MQIGEEMEEIDRLMRVANRSPSKPARFDVFVNSAFQLSSLVGCPSPVPGARRLR
jgi:hypothetical protein